MLKGLQTPIRPWRLRSPRSLDALRERNFRLLFCGQAVSLIGDGMVNVALAFAVIALTGSASDVGLVLAARTLPQVGLLLVGGVVADRLPRQRVMLAADVARMVSHGAIAALLIGEVATMSALCALAALSGTATAFFKPASTRLLPELISHSELLRANALMRSAQAVGMILGPALAGVLVASVGQGWALALDAGTFAVSAAFLAQLHTASEPRPRGRSIAADLREGWDAFRSGAWLWTCVANDAVLNLLFACWNVLGPLMAARALGGAAAWGAIVATYGVGLLAGGLLSLRLQPRRPLVLVTATALLVGVPLALLALEAPAALVAAGAFASGTGNMIGITVWQTTLQRHIAPSVLSRVSAYDWLASLAVQPVGLAAWGPFAAAVGLGPALWTACVLGTASTLAVLAVPAVRRLPAYPG